MCECCNVRVGVYMVFVMCACVGFEMFWCVYMYGL